MLLHLEKIRNLGRALSLFFWVLAPGLGLMNGVSWAAAPGEASVAHHSGTGFRNLHIQGGKRMGDFLRWRLGLGPSEIPALPPGNLPPFRPQVLAPDLNCLNHAQPDTVQVTWLGHSTFLIQVAGLNILTDPIFSQRASPVGFAGPRRLTPPPLPLEKLPPIQAVILSHNHYDHLDEASILRLDSRVNFFVPLGLSAWFTKRGRYQVQELDWWQVAELGPIRFHCVPAQHFSIRSPWDANTTLWAGWVLETPVGKVYFAGDTGYSPDFQEIGRRLGPMRLSLIPIGGYSPRWFMRPMHLDAAEAVLVHQEVRSRLSIGMHWGTFKLTEEPLAEPPLYLERVLRERGLPQEAFIVLKFGETRILSLDPGDLELGPRQEHFSRRTPGDETGPEALQPPK